MEQVDGAKGRGIGNDDVRARLHDPEQLGEQLPVRLRRQFMVERVGDNAVVAFGFFARIGCCIRQFQMHGKAEARRHLAPVLQKQGRQVGTVQFGLGEDAVHGLQRRNPATTGLIDLGVVVFRELLDGAHALLRNVVADPDRRIAAMAKDHRSHTESEKRAVKVVTVPAAGLEMPFDAVVIFGAFGPRSEIEGAKVLDVVLHRVEG